MSYTVEYNNFYYNDIGVEITFGNPNQVSYNNCSHNFNA